MRVDKGDLDNAVVEDGESAVILKSDSQAVTAKSEVTQALNSNANMTGQEKSQQNGSVSDATKQRVPVEDSEEDECEKENGGDDLENLTKSLKDCNIQETAKLGIEEKLSELAVKDKDEDEENEDDTQCNSLQSQSSIIAVDPPSLPHEEEEEKGETTEELMPRGPITGKPTNYRPNNDAYNHVARKSYTTHNLDRFHAQSSPFSPHPQAMNGFSQGGFMQNGLSQPSYYNMDPQMNGGAAQVYSNVPMSSGKRGMDEDEDNPFKYTRPVETDSSMGYGAPQTYMNDLSGDMKKQPAVISQRHGCGGQVLDNSPDILSSNGNPFQLQPSISIDGFLESLNAHDQQFPPMNNPYQAEFGFSQQTSQADKAGQGVRGDYDAGYTSENSPHSETMGSPGSSPKSHCSPMRPPSNMSQDSGIASPFSHGVPSPPEDSSHSRNWVPGPEEYSSSQFSVSDSSQSAVYMSPHSAAMSPASTIMSPQSTINMDDLSMTSPLSVSDVDFLAGRKDELKDALEVVANDMKGWNKKKVGGQASQDAHRNMAPAALQNRSSPVAVPNNGISHNIPISVAAAQQKSDRPGKLPIPPLNKQSQQTTTTSMMPVVVMPTSTSGHAAATTAVPVTSSQPVLLMSQPQGQAPSLIVVVNNSPAPPAQTASKKKQPVPIRPRPGPAISNVAPSPSTPSNKSNPPTPKSESSAPSPKAVSVNGNGVTPGQNGVRPSACVQPNSTPASTGKKGRNPQQCKMLNIARRLVASMTASDLSFQDAEGDTYLHVSVCKADCNMVQALLERMYRENLQSLINTQNNMRQTPLYLAVSSNAPEMVELLIRYNADVNVFAEHTMADGRTKEIKAALHCAASNGDQYLATLQALLASGELNIDQVNSDGHTALHCAILEHGKPGSEGGVVNNLPIIQTLIRQGADPNAQGKKSGKTALMYALESKDINLIENVVALIDPARLRTYLKSQAFDGSSCLRIMENIQRGMDEASRQRLHACLKITGRRDNSGS